MISFEGKTAQKYCSNYRRGICEGVHIETQAIKGFTTPVLLYIDDKKAGKKCTTIVEKCGFYKSVVLPGVP
jgi:hypothetical protein